jgi:uncharacterized protein YcbX
VPVRLVSKGATPRPLNPRYLPAQTLFAHTPQTAFSDGWPFLLLSEPSLADLNAHLDAAAPRASFRNFRPNIVIHGCAPFEVWATRGITVGARGQRGWERGGMGTAGGDVDARAHRQRGRPAHCIAVCAVLCDACRPGHGRRRAAQPRRTCMLGQGALGEFSRHCARLRPQALSQYRRVDAGSPSAVCFGVNACQEAVGGTVRVGDAIAVLATGQLVL